MKTPREINKKSGDLLKMMLYNWIQLGALGGISLVNAIVSTMGVLSVLRTEVTSVFYQNTHTITSSSNGHHEYSKSRRSREMQFSHKRSKFPTEEIRTAQNF